MLVDIFRFFEIHHIDLLTAFSQQHSIFIGHQLSLVKTKSYSFCLLLFIISVWLPHRGGWPDKTDHPVPCIEWHDHVVVYFLCRLRNTFSDESTQPFHQHLLIPWKGR